MTKQKQPLTLQQKGDLGPKQVRSIDWKPRTKRKGEATAPTMSWRTAADYKVGDGDHNVYIPRTGSCHKHLLSHGDRT
jgi:hypothetical protein